MTSSSKNRTKKMLTLSFNDNADCITIDDSVIEMPHHDLNGTVIDLTGYPSTTKALELDMMISKSILISSSEESSKTQMHMVDRNNNFSRQCTSKQALALSDYKAPSPSQPKKSSTIRKTLELSLKADDLFQNSNLNVQPKQGGQNLIDNRDNYLIENPEEIVCSLCGNFCVKFSSVLLRNCFHSFCRPCLVNTINIKSELGAVKCPLQIENCDTFLEDAEIRALLGEECYAIYVETIRLRHDQMAERDRELRNEEESLLPLLLNMDDLETIPNVKDFECPICFTQINVGEGIILKNCLHPACRTCLSSCIKVAEEFEVKCPFISSDNIPCAAVLEEREIKNLVSKEIFEKHLQKSLNIAESANELSFHCKTPDCPYFLEIAEGIITFDCPACKKPNCVTCKAVHEGKSCVEYQEEKNPQLKDQRLRDENKASESAISEMIKQGTAMYCPRCQIPVQKIIGCDFITCTACKLGICWVTKKPRLSFKKADGTVVMGCQCKENGLKCHPNCGNCH